MSVNTNIFARKFVFSRRFCRSAVCIFNIVGTETLRATEICIYRLTRSSQKVQYDINECNSPSLFFGFNLFVLSFLTETDIFLCSKDNTVVCAKGPLRNSAVYW